MKSYNKIMATFTKAKADLKVYVTQQRSAAAAQNKKSLDASRKGMAATAEANRAVKSIEQLDIMLGN